MREALLNEALIKEIALQVVQQGLLSNWLFYAVLLALSLVSGAIGAYLSKYFGKRGETAAIKADFNEILRQLEKTTKVAEEVRSAVSHADWVAREWKTIRRIKLEELVDSALSVKDWSLDIMSSYCNVVSENENESPDKKHRRKIRIPFSPAEKTFTISILYFSDIDIQTQLPTLCHSLEKESFALQQLFLKISVESIEKNKFIEPAEFGWGKQNSILLNIIDEIKNEAARIMKDIEREDGRKEKLDCS